MSDCNENYDGYIAKTVDPGPAMLIGTALFSALLLASLPCLLSITLRFKRRRGFIGSGNSKEKWELDARDDMKQYGIKDSAPNVKTGRNHTDDNDDESVISFHSARTGVSGAATTLLNLILDSAPHGGPHPRNNHYLIVQRDQMLETEANHERSPWDDAMESVSVAGGGSVVGKLNHDDVSVKDAVDAVFNDSDEKCSDIKTPCCSARSIATTFEKLLTIAEFDYESKRIIKLGAPFMIQGLITGIAETVSVAIIGHSFGTTALSSYYVVCLVIGVTTQFLKGVQDALVTLCSHSLGVGNLLLTGQYLQMTLIIYTCLYVPLFVFWYYFVADTIKWFGLDQQTANAGQDFAILLLLSYLLHGLDECVHSLLNVIGCENFSTVMVTLREIFTTVGVYITSRGPNPNLQQLGYVYVGVCGIELVLSVVIVLWNGWFDPYLEGIVGSFALTNIKGVRVLLGTSISLSFGYLLTNGEWNLLTFFAGLLGPAELAVWGILGTIWSALEVVTTAIGNAAEVRTSFLLGAGQPANAKISSYKSLYIGLFATIVITSGLFIAGDQIPTWMTSDNTLKYMIADLLPLFGIGNIALSIGSISWTLVGAQGRYRLATLVGFAGSWLVSIPLSALFSMYFHFDLQAQVAAIVMGYMVSGTINTCILMQSDWAYLSRKVIENNTEQGTENSESDDDSSASSKSYSSSSKI